MDKIPAVPAMDDEAGRRKFATEIEKIVTYVASHKRAYSYLVRSNDGRSLIYDYAHDCIDVRMQIDNLPGDDKRYISEMTYRIHGIIASGKTGQAACSTLPNRIYLGNCAKCRKLRLSSEHCGG